MTISIWKIRSAMLTVVLILTLIFLFIGSPVIAAEIPLGGTGVSHDMIAAEIPLGGTGVSQDVMSAQQTIVSDEVSPLPIETIKETPSQKPSVSASSGKVGVNVSPNSFTMNGQMINLVAGYLTGDPTGSKIIISGKKSSDSDFSDIITLLPDENGIFIWAVPNEQKDLDLFRVTVKSGSSRVQSKTIGFTVAGKDTITQPVKVPNVTVVQTMKPTPAQALNPTVTGNSSTPSSTTLVISAPTTTPVVGDQIAISGQLTDKEGKGIGGATVTIDETGYPGAGSGEPFVTVQTASDGRFESSLGVSVASTVGLVASYKGDENYGPAESNIITFTAHG
jgi:hypothetical protein